MRGMALLVWTPLLAVALAATEQTQTPRTPAPSSPTAGAAGAAAPAPASVTPATSDASADSRVGAILGRVIRADTGQPLEGAKVGSFETGFSISDTDGHFALRDVPAGSHRITASRSGFVTAQYGVRKPGDGARPITVGAGQVTSGIDIALLKGAVLAGFVTDARGEPAVSAPVWVFRRVFVDGAPRLDTAGSDLADDHGRFRVFGLLPGTYVLGAAPAGRTPEIRAYFSGNDSPTMYPGTQIPAEAQTFTLQAGDEVGGLSLRLQTVDVAVIRGTVTTAGGTPLPASAERRPNDFVGRREVRIVRQSEFAARTVTATLLPNGTFGTLPLPPGQYTVMAALDGLSAIERVNLDGREFFVPLVLSRGRSVRGRVVSDTGTFPAGYESREHHCVCTGSGLTSGVLHTGKR